MMHFLTVSGCKINVDNIFQLNITLDCSVSICNVELFVCCHLFCTCACVTYLHVLYLILVQGQVRNHYLSGCPEFLNGDGCFSKVQPNCQGNQDPR